MKIILMSIMTFMTSYHNNLSSSGKSEFPTSVLRSVSRKFFLPLLTVMVLLAGCEEDPTDIGSGILPEADFVNMVSTDTFSIDLYTQYFDAFKSMSPNYSHLGSSYNPYFGLSSSDFVSQLWLYTSWPAAGAVVDSLILSLQVVDVIGEIIGDQEVNIYEVDEFMHLDSVYYTNRSVPVKQFLGSFTISPGTAGDTILQVHLPLTMAYELIRDTTMLFLSSEIDDFRNYFNGLYFEYPQTDNHHLLKVNMLGGNSAITMYYKDTLEASQSFIFLFNTRAVLYNRYQHDFEAADPEKKIKYINQPVKDTLTYVQGMNGVFTKIHIPGLEGLKNEMPVSINKARLFLPVYVNDTDFTEDLIPEKLIASYIDSEGERQYLPDFWFSTDFFDGSYNAINDRYTLNIANFVQQYLNGEIPEPAIEIALSLFDEEYLITNNLKPQIGFLLSLYNEAYLILKANDAVISPHIEIVYTDLK